MPTYNRPDMVQQAIASLLRQDDAGFEVIVVDDGSTDHRVAEVLDGMAPIFRERGWTIIRQPNAGPAAARRAARARAKGTHILLMDDDNIALSHEIGMFRRAAMSGADILTCIPGQHPANTVGPAPVAMLPGTDPDWPTVAVDWTPVGPSPALAIFTNCLGDNNCLVRAEVFDALGGQGNDPQNVFEDYVFLLRAMFAGYRIEVIPEVLFLYRRHEESRCMGSRAYYSHLKSLETFFEHVPAPLRPLLLTLRKGWYDRHKASCVEEGQA
jgi:glycosyltransferase involved in cell wall biosynthesis